MGGLLVRESWFVRSLRWLKLLRVDDRPTFDDVNAGLDFGQSYSTRAGFAAIDSLSAIAVDPWIYAAAKTVALDMAGLPLKARRGQGADAAVLDQHPVLDLLRRPSTRIPAPLFHAQLWLDLLLTGIWVALITRDARGRPAGLLRLHPERCSIISDKTGQVEAIEYEAGDDRIRYPWETVLFCALPSWEEGPRGLFGTGAIRSLKDDIESSIQLKKRTKESARKGRPDMMASPRTPETAPNATAREKLQLEMNRRMSNIDGGCWIAPPDFEFTQLSQTLKDLQGAEQLDRIRQAVMAVLHVPPIKLGLETANYATSNNQLVEYWTHYLLVSTIPGWQFSRLAAELGKPGDEVYYDGSGIDAFQEARTAKLARIQSHVLLGMTETDAYAYEGMSDAPIEVAQAVSQEAALNGAQLSAAVQIVSDVASGLIPRASGIALLVSAGIAGDEAEATSIMSNAGAGFAPTIPGDSPAPAVPAPVVGAAAEVSTLKAWLTPTALLEVRTKAPADDAERAKAWHDWDEKAATPAENALTFTVAKMLRAQRVRMQKRLAVAMSREGARATGTDGIVTKAPPEDIVTEVADTDAELEAMTKDMSPALKRIVEAAFKRTRGQLGVASLTFDAAQSEHEAFAATMAAQVQELTREGVRDIVARGLDDGSTISDMQRELQQAYAFSPQRARQIARTESTRALNSGATQAMEAAGEGGVPIKGRMWLSSRDAAVREAHKELDGQVAAMDGTFDHDGHQAAYPGDFGVPDLDINCRCTVIPVLED